MFAVTKKSFNETELIRSIVPYLDYKAFSIRNLDCRFVRQALYAIEIDLQKPAVLHAVYAQKSSYSLRFLFL